MKLPVPDFRKLFESSPGLSLALSPEFHVLAATNAYLEATCTKREEITGRSLLNVFYHKPINAISTGVNNLYASLKRVLINKTPDTIPMDQYDIPLPDGRSSGEKCWRFSNIPILNEHNEIEYIIHHIEEDVTEVLKAGREELLTINEEMRAKAEELERSNNFKTEFLSNVSHELRTPLNSMLILSTLLTENKTQNLTSKQLEQVTTINKAGRDLLALINDILDLSKIEAGKMETVLEDTPVIDIKENMELLFRPIATQKEINFIVHMDKGLPEHIVTDGLRCGQILKNLLSNAFKFTRKEGTVTMSISRSNTSLAFAISDTGIGISPSKQAYIFEAFRQADGSTSRQYGGTGLGLSISRHLTDLLGGKIYLESEEGKGSIFTLYLPLVYMAAQQANNKPGNHAEVNNEHHTPTAIIKPGSIPATPQAGLKELMRQKTILVTDDDERNIIALQMILEDYKPNFLIATNGKEAIQLLKEHRPVDLVLMDIMMPVMDGFQAMQAIRQHQQFKSLPIIALTAKSIKSERDECLQAGASDYLSKPIDVQNLLGSIETWLKASPPGGLAYCA